MNPAEIAHLRLHNQGISTTRFADASAVVEQMGAVQAQDFAGAKWSLGLRVAGANDDQIEQAFDEGSILRTHVMRPTWHFVAPADIRWLLALTAPRVKATMAYMNRQIELDESVFAQTTPMIARVLEGGKPLTRAELGAALAQAGMVFEGLRLTTVVGWAELDAVICSGPRRGKQFTYMLVDERAPQAKKLTRDEALAELTRRYFTAHAPATAHDFAWWSGLTVTDAKAGIKRAADQLDHDLIDGKTHWFSTSTPSAAAPFEAALLLPTYDEFLVGYAGFDRSRRAGRLARGNTFDPSLVIGGKVVGSWRRTLGKQQVDVEVLPFDPLSAAESEAVAQAVKRYGEFLGLPTRLRNQLKNPRRGHIIVI